MMPFFIISATVSAQSLTLLKPAITSLASSGFGVNFTVISVITPSKPSDPFINASKPIPSSCRVNNNSSPSMVSILIASTF